MLCGMTCEISVRPRQKKGETDSVFLSSFSDWILSDIGNFTRNQ